MVPRLMAAHVLSEGNRIVWHLPKMNSNCVLDAHIGFRVRVRVEESEGVGAGSAMNPVDWIHDLYKPGDYIAFKLDIDNEAVEGELIQQVLAMENAGGIIAEMFFEKHYSAADMQKYFGTPTTKYPAALRLMHELRAKGVRVHYWP